jgi:hypothetical protein
MLAVCALDWSFPLAACVLHSQPAALREPVSLTFELSSPVKIQTLLTPVA